jgi:hypothetical protein
MVLGSNFEAEYLELCTVESKTARRKHRKECPLRMCRRRKLAINILSLQSSFYAVL